MAVASLPAYLSGSQNPWSKNLSHHIKQALLSMALGYYRCTRRHSSYLLFRRVILVTMALLTICDYQFLLRFKAMVPPTATLALMSCPLTWRYTSLRASVGYASLVYPPQVRFSCGSSLGYKHCRASSARARGKYGTHINGPCPYLLPYLLPYFPTYLLTSVCTKPLVKRRPGIAV